MDLENYSNRAVDGFDIVLKSAGKLPKLLAPWTESAYLCSQKAFLGN